MHSTELAVSKRTAAPLLPQKVACSITSPPTITRSSARLRAHTSTLRHLLKTPRQQQSIAHTSIHLQDPFSNISQLRARRESRPGAGSQAWNNFTPTLDHHNMATPLAEQSGPHRHMAEDKTSAATIAQPSAVATCREDDAQVFRFFDLPRELRDNIYEQPVLAKHWYMRPDMWDDFCIRAEKLNTSLLLVSRQFRDEYVERCCEEQVLCLRDRTHWKESPVYWLHSTMQSLGSLPCAQPSFP